MAATILLTYASILAGSNAKTALSTYISLSSLLPFAVTVFHKLLLEEGPHLRSWINATLTTRLSHSTSSSTLTLPYLVNCSISVLSRIETSLFGSVAFANPASITLLSLVLLTISVWLELVYSLIEVMAARNEVIGLANMAKQVSASLPPTMLEKFMRSFQVRSSDSILGGRSSEEAATGTAGKEPAVTPLTHLAVYLRLADGLARESRTYDTNSIGLIQMLMDTRMSKQQEHLLADLEASIAYSSRLLQNSVLFFKADTGCLTMDMSLRISVQQLFDMALADQTRELENNRNVNVIRNVDPNFPVLLGDVNYMSHIIQLLVENSAKYTVQGTVTLGARVIEMTTTGSSSSFDEHIAEEDAYVNDNDNEHDVALVEFSVTDTGCGIPAAQLPLLKTPFSTHYSEFWSVNEGLGSGIGIPTADCLARAFPGGRMDIESEEGKGTRIVIRCRLRIDQSAHYEQFGVEKSIDGREEHRKIAICAPEETYNTIVGMLAPHGFSFKHITSKAPISDIWFDVRQDSLGNEPFSAVLIDALSLGLSPHHSELVYSLAAQLKSDPVTADIPAALLIHAGYYAQDSKGENYSEAILKPLLYQHVTAAVKRMIGSRETTVIDARAWGKMAESGAGSTAISASSPLLPSASAGSSSAPDSLFVPAITTRASSSEFIEAGGARSSRHRANGASTTAPTATHSVPSSPRQLSGRRSSMGSLPSASSSHLRASSSAVFGVPDEDDNDNNKPTSSIAYSVPTTLSLVNESPEESSPRVRSMAPHAEEDESLIEPPTLSQASPSTTALQRPPVSSTASSSSFTSSASSSSSSTTSTAPSESSSGRIASAHPLPPPTSPLPPRLIKATSSIDSANLAGVMGRRVSDQAMEEARLNVLVVEDDPTNRLVLQRMIINSGQTCIAADNGISGVETYKAENGKFDLVIMDLRMPQLDGFQATHIIRQFEIEHQLPPVEIIALTAEDGTRSKCVQAGMNDCWIKPLKAHFLQSSLLERVARKVDRPTTKPQSNQGSPERQRGAPLPYRRSSSPTPIGKTSADDDLGLEYPANLPWESAGGQYKLKEDARDRGSAGRNRRGGRRSESASNTLNLAPGQDAMVVEDLAPQRKQQHQQHQQQGDVISAPIPSGVGGPPSPHLTKAPSPKDTSSPSSSSAVAQLQASMSLRSIGGAGGVVTGAAAAGGLRSRKPIVPLTSSQAEEARHDFIMLVEDNATVAKIATTVLARNHQKTEHSVDGQEAFEKLTTDHSAFSIVLMDIHLPKIGGFECTALIREFEQKHHLSPLYIVALSGDRNLDADFYRQHGFNDLLRKPLNYPSLINELPRMRRDHADMREITTLRGSSTESASSSTGTSSAASTPPPTGDVSLP